MTTLERTVGPNALASPSDMATRPALAAAYGTYPGRGLIAAVLEMLMIEPPSPLAIRVPTSAPSRNGPFRLTAIVLSNRSSLDRVERGVHRRDAGVVDQDVDPAQRGVHVVDQPADLLPAAEVTGPGQGPPPRFLGYLLGDIAARRLVRGW